MIGVEVRQEHRQQAEQRPTLVVVDGAGAGEQRFQLGVLVR